MRRIRKSAEPRCLLAHRKKSGATYASLPSKATECKDQIRDALLEDQGRLCVYCMRRIKKVKASQLWTWMRIEHLRAQSSHPELQLTWANLFAVCPGQGDRPDNARTSPREHHCDRRKGDTRITLNPLDASLERLLAYDEDDGRILSATGDPVVQAELDEVLNLNVASLRRGRKEALTGLVEALHKKNRGIWTGEELRLEASRLETPRDKELVPHLGILLWWLRKRRGAR